MEKTVPVKTVMWAVGSLIAGASLSLAVQSQLLIPAILRDVIKEIDARIETHREHGPHPGAMVRDEYTQDRVELMNALDGLATKESVQAVLSRIEALHQ